MPIAGHFDFPRIDGERRERLWVVADGVDPQLLRQLFEEHGAGMVPLLHGGFAFALWDGETLLLARDAFGQKPLYYAEKGGQLWFATDGHGLRRHAGHIDRGALSDYLELLYVPAPASIWSGLHKLPAGHLLRAGAEGIEVRRWFELPAAGCSPKRPSRIAVRARLEEAVRAEEPSAGIWLSGELPSMALVALMTRRHGRVLTFSPDADPLARRIAERFRSEHHEVAGNALDEIPRVLQGPEPLGDAQLAVHAAALRAMGAKVVLTSAGGAELFGGHARYLRAARLPHSQRAARAANFLRRIAPRRHRGRLQRAAGALGTKGAGRARALLEVFSMDERRALLGSHARSAEGATGDNARGADAAIAFDLEVTLPDGTLALLQAASASAGVVVRAPLLDPRLAQTVVPPVARHKLGRAHGNRLLREAVADLLPRDALLADERRPSLPLGVWLRGPLRPLLHDLVRPPSASIRALLDPRAIDEVLRHSLAPRGDARQAFALLALEIWARAARSSPA